MTPVELHGITGILQNLQWKSDFGGDSYASDVAYEGADFFEVGDQKGMHIN